MSLPEIDDAFLSPDRHSMKIYCVIVVFFYTFESGGESNLNTFPLKRARTLKCSSQQRCNIISHSSQIYSHRVRWRDLQAAEERAAIRNEVNGAARHSKSLSRSYSQIKFMYRENL
jgi:hypothetical protein